MNPFSLHPALIKVCVAIGDLPLCRVLLMNNLRFPWLVLVPRRADMRELFDLTPEDYALVMAEIRSISSRLAEAMQADKINVAALGNMVPQLHIHIIARYEDDDAWPQPVWNSALAPKPYPAAKLPGMLEKLRAMLNITKM